MFEILGFYNSIPNKKSITRIKFNTISKDFFLGKGEITPANILTKKIVKYKWNVTEMPH